MKLLKNKKVLIGVSGLFVIVLCIGLYLCFNKDDNIQVYKNKNEEIEEQISGFNGIAMMYETGPGTGEYSESKSSLWPDSGYIFNKNLSTCENGGELSWNDETKAVTLHSNKSDSCYVYFDAYIIPVINSVTTSNITTDSITLTVNATNGNNLITTYYYSKDNGNSYETSNSNTYTFSGLDMGTVYNFSVYVEDNEGYKSEVFTLSETTDDAILLADWVTSQYNGIQGNNGIYYHTSSLANSAGDNSYRYSGANPNNYVCFGSDASTCPSDNLYRIIGVFGDNVKLIKSTSYGNYVWDSSNNTWNFNTKPDIRNTLNTTFLNTLSSTWQNKIATHEYKVGGMEYSYGTSIPKTAYNYEVGSNSSSTTDSMKIGLMYVSDYGFASNDNYWTTTLINYDKTTASNWMCLGSMEWTISRSSDYTDIVFFVFSSGYVGTIFNFSSTADARAVRPVFYLTSSTSYVSGSGTSADPIRVN